MSAPLPANTGDGAAVAEMAERDSLGWLLLMTSALILAASALGGLKRAR